ncbi:MAG: glycosyltransferase family 39 protein, partial [Caldilineaceae bacterium]|nr:glycosyltransferase family 39 protein [Caldilineaceae bacterium]
MATTDRTQSTHWLILLLWVAFALYLFQLNKQNIWWDEARNIDVALRPFGQIATAPELDIHPPVYFWLLHIWGRLAGLPALSQNRLPPMQMAFLTRFLSVFMGVLSVALLYGLVRQAVRSLNAPQAAAWAAAVGALSPFWLAESQETRMYTVEFALLLAAAIPFLSLLRQTAAPTPVGRRFLPAGTFVLFASLALLTHYNAVFILIAWYGYWLLAALTAPKRMRNLRTLLTCGIATALLFAPVTPIALRQIPG